MKKFLTGLASIVLALPLYAQTEKSNVSVEKSGGSPASTGLSPYSGTPVLGDIIYFDGTNWVSLNKPADGTYSIKFTSSIPSYIAASSGGVATDAIWTANGQAATGTGTGTAVAVTPTTPGQELKYNGTTTDFRLYPVDPTTESVLWNEFVCRPQAVASGVCGDFITLPTGTGAGWATAVTGVTITGNEVGIIEMTTGTSTTGITTTQTQTDKVVLLSGGEVLEWRIDLPVLSGGTNTFKMWVGFCDTITSADCTDGAYFTLDSNTDTHWVINTANNTTRTTTTSNLVATTGWHRLKIVVNAAATSVAYFVDGAQLNVSPLSTNIPTASVRDTGIMTKLVASAGCAAATTCVEDVDFVYFRKPLTR